MSTYDRLERIGRAIMYAERDIQSNGQKLEKAERTVAEQTRRLTTIDSAVTVMQSIASELQTNVKDKIVSTVQAALDSTFPGVVFGMELTSRRGQTEMDVFVTDDKGNRQTILDGCGGGIKDIVSFALRVAVWSLDRDASPVILLDEPFKFLSAGHRNQGAELLHTLSRNLGVQFLVVSHVPEIINNADKVYAIEKGADGRSSAKIV